MEQDNFIKINKVLNKTEEKIQALFSKRSLELCLQSSFSIFILGFMTYTLHSDYLTHTYPPTTDLSSTFLLFGFGLMMGAISLLFSDNQSWNRVNPKKVNFGLLLPFLLIVIFYIFTKVSNIIVIDLDVKTLGELAEQMSMYHLHNVFSNILGLSVILFIFYLVCAGCSSFFNKKNEISFDMDNIGAFFLMTTLIFMGVLISSFLISYIVPSSSINIMIVMTLVFFLVAGLMKSFKHKNTMTEEEKKIKEEEYNNSKNKLLMQVDNSIKDLFDLELFQIYISEEDEKDSVNEELKELFSKKKEALIKESKYNNFEDFKKEKLRENKNKSEAVIENF